MTKIDLEKRRNIIHFAMKQIREKDRNNISTERVCQNIVDFMEKELKENAD